MSPFSLYTLHEQEEKEMKEMKSEIFMVAGVYLRVVMV
jgi:hypothetical protein